MEVLDLPISALMPYEHNVKKHTDKDVSKIVESIKRYGFNDPLGVWGENNLIVEGHGRYIAAQKLGMDTVPCIRLDHLTEQERREYAIVHNKSSEIAEWDEYNLETELSEIDLSAFEFDFDGLERADDFGTDFALPSGENDGPVQMTFIFAREQKQAIITAMNTVRDEITETFGNTNVNGNALYTVIKQWEMQKK